MLSRRIIILSALFMLVVAFAWGLVHLFSLRFAGGDVYPEYSSMRADPVGTKAYYESLGRINDVRLRRNFRAPEHLPSGRGSTLFVFGLPVSELRAEESEFRKLDSFVREGGRLVVTLYPEFARWRVARASKTNAPTFKKSNDEQPHPPIDLRDKWGFGIGAIDIDQPKGSNVTSVPVRTMMPTVLPESMAWHTTVIFTNVALEWRVIYARGTDPVMIERQLGAGSIVLASDSYFVSNEALQKHREPRLLAWLPGASRDVIFDEVHLGIQEQPGVAGLARRYNLHGAGVALLVLAGLFVWKNSLSFVPPAKTDPNAASTAQVQGRESASGFINLLRRSIAPGELLQTCINEWHKTRQMDRRVSPRKLDAIAATVEAHNTAASPKPVETYNAISKILNDR